MHSTLVNLRVYDDAHRLKQRMDDEMNYLIGRYTYEAISVALSNAFRKKGAKAIHYREKPFLTELEEELKNKEHLANLTEEEKRKYTDDLFAMLGEMQEKFEKSKGRS